MRRRDTYGADPVGGIIDVNLTNWLAEDLLPMDVRAKLLVEISIDTVKSRLHYSRRTLKKQLGVNREKLLGVLYDFT